MRDMEYLTEKDLPYFDEKAKKGEAVIIYTDPDALLEAEEAVGEFLYLEEQRRRSAAAISEEELMAFLEENHLLLSEEAKKQEKLIRENKELQDMIAEEEKILENMREKDKQPVEKIIAASDGDADMLATIRKAIGDGFTDDEIRMVTVPDLNPEKRSELYEAIKIGRF